jgi:hypothetical protein
VSGSYPIPSQRESELREKCEGRHANRPRETDARVWIEMCWQAQPIRSAFQPRAGSVSTCWSEMHTALHSLNSGAPYSTAAMLPSMSCARRQGHRIPRRPHRRRVLTAHTLSRRRIRLCSSYDNIEETRDAGFRQTGNSIARKPVRIESAASHLAASRNCCHRLARLVAVVGSQQARIASR